MTVGGDRMTVSSRGRVMTAAGVPTSGCAEAGSYHRFRKYNVHRLIAEAFCPRPAGATVVNHLDGDRSNNAATNLEWTTKQGNTLHAYRQGLARPVGGKPVEQVMSDGGTVWHASAHEASRTTGVARPNISAVCRGSKNSAGGFGWRFALAGAPNKLTDGELDALLDGLL